MIDWPDGVEEGPDGAARELPQRHVWASAVWITQDGVARRRWFNVVAKTWRWDDAPLPFVFEDGRLGLVLGSFISLERAIATAWLHRHPISGPAVRELFDVFKPTDGAIALAGLAGVNMKAGAAEIKLLKELGDMDFDGDGLLTFDEMCSYFAQVGTALNDEEFDLIVEEMRTAATAYALAMTLQE